MNSNAYYNPSDKDVMKHLIDLKQELSRLTEKVDDIALRLDSLNKLMTPKEKQEIEEYLQDTINAIIDLDNRNLGLPLSRTEIAEELAISPSTAYIRCEKLVQKGKLVKFYGRELGKEIFEEKKAVYYTLPRTVYNLKYRETLETVNEVAHRIILTLLQQQPISEEELLNDSELSATEVKEGILYLLSRGLIIQEIKANKSLYRLRD